MKYEARNVTAPEAQSQVLDLWRTLPSPPTESMFRWSYLTNPLGPAQCFLLRTATEPKTVVGMAGLNARNIEVNGEPISAALLGGFYVDKAHRTLFPALTLQRAVLAWSRANFDLVYGFPNESAAPVLKRLGFRDLIKLSRYVLVLRHARYVQPYVKSRRVARLLSIPVDGWRRVVQPGISLDAPRGFVFRRHHDVDARFDRLFRARALKDLTIGDRSAAHLRWRFLQRPDQPAALYALSAKSSGELAGYVVVHHEGTTAHVRDLLAVDLDSMLTVLRLGAGEARRRGASALSFLCAGPYDLTSRLFELGFRDRSSTRTLIGYVGDRLSKDPAKARVLTQLERWYVTEADEDQ